MKYAVRYWSKDNNESTLVLVWIEACFARSSIPFRLDHLTFMYIEIMKEDNNI